MEFASSTLNSGLLSRESAMSDKKWRQADEGAVAKLMVLGLYESWESNELELKVYVVLSCGLNLETLAPQATLAPLYGRDAGFLKTRHLFKNDGLLEPVGGEDGQEILYAGPKYRLLAEHPIHSLRRILLHAKECAEQKTLEDLMSFIEQVIEE